jgi:hypothetical protein
MQLRMSEYTNILLFLIAVICDTQRSSTTELTVMTDALFYEEQKKLSITLCIFIGSHILLCDRIKIVDPSQRTSKLS